MFKIILSLFLIIFSVINAQDYSDNESVQLLQQYIRINTTTYNNLDEAVLFWTRLASEVNVSIQVQELTAGFPIIVITWPGSDPSLSGIMLNSHMDVVPALEDDWTHGPFSGDLDDEGTIWGRGTQDMKSVGIQYYSALKNLGANESTLLRNVYMTLMPDEEVGGGDGMVKFLDSDWFKSLNVGFELDEGAAVQLPVVPMFYQDKSVWQIQVDCYGPGGHGSSLPAINTTAVGKCLNVANLLLQFRQEEYTKSLNAPITNAGVYTSVNINVIKAGSANNVIPSVATLITDIRLGTAVNEVTFQQQLEDLIYSAGDNITVTYILKNQQSPAAVVNASNPYLGAIMQAAQESNITILPVIPPGATDARYVRDILIPAFGISPMPNTPQLLHTVNERLSASTLINGVDFYTKAIKYVANLGSNIVSPDSSTYVIDTQED